MNNLIPNEFATGIKELSIDASSVIYLLKAGLLGTLAAEVHLVTTKPVFEEVGWPRLPIEIINIECVGLTNDQTVIKLAEIRQSSILSEDLEILKSAKESGINYYNTLMMLNFLLLKGRVLKSDYKEYLDRIVEISHYSKDILKYGEKIYQHILTQI